MQEDIRKRDILIQDLYKQFQSPTPNNNNNNGNMNIMKELIDARKEIEQLKESTNQLRQSQQEISMVLNTPERTMHERTIGGQKSGGSSARERSGKWQEFLETPISVSQRRSNRPTPRQSR